MKKYIYGEKTEIELSPVLNDCRPNKLFSFYYNNGDKIDNKH